MAAGVAAKRMLSGASFAHEVRQICFHLATEKHTYCPQIPKKKLIRCYNYIWGKILYYTILMGANRRSRSCVITFKCIVAVLRIYKTVTYANLYVYILVNKFTERERE